jgi:hypothetical protein
MIARLFGEAVPNNDPKCVIVDLFELEVGIALWHVELCLDLLVMPAQTIGLLPYL